MVSIGSMQHRGQTVQEQTQIPGPAQGQTAGESTSVIDERYAEIRLRFSQQGDRIIRVNRSLKVTNQYAAAQLACRFVHSIVLKNDQALKQSLAPRHLTPALNLHQGGILKFA